MDDYIFRATAFAGQVRVFAATSAGMANEAVNIHKTRPTATAALCRTLTAAAILGRTLKNEDDLLSLIIKCEGPIESIVVTSDAGSNVKGYVGNPACDLPLKENGKTDLRSAVAAGTLTVVRDMGLKESYSGKIELISGEIADDLTYYFAKSEQIPTSIALGEIINPDLSVASCGGLMIQLLPGADESIDGIIYDKLACLPPISQLLAFGETPEDIAERIFGGYDIEPLGKYPLFYRCNCGREKMEQALLSIGRKDLIIIAEEDKGAEICCHFCGKKYMFSEEELKELLKNAK